MTERLTFSSGSRTLNAQLAVPEGGGPFPAVVIIHEAFGLNQNIREVAARFAAEGYVALAVDLFAGRNPVLCMARFMGGMLTNSLEHGGVADMKAALGVLAARPEVNPEQLGAVGYCMGGSFALALACTDGRLKAIAPYYAMNPRPLSAVERACPVVGSYPGNDFTTRAGRLLEAELTGHGIPHDIKIYEGAKHSFNNDHAATYDAAASTDAWQRTLSFFSEHVRGQN
ncbi:dienelactone hydrolase family protein [Deinococcus sp.]|uniref:dienelactone hydrolase family protein n=1 Tax=Deinococcus sp. TaxID=47478 RepID=UPI003C7DF063